MGLKRFCDLCKEEIMLHGHYLLKTGNGKLERNINNSLVEPETWSSKQLVCINCKAELDKLIRRLNPNIPEGYDDPKPATKEPSDGK